MDNIKRQSLLAAGELASTLHKEVAAMIRPGLNILEIEKHVHTRIDRAGMTPAFLGFNGYTAATCISINEEIVHGIPINRTLEEGDIISVDLGVAKNGWIVDTARTYGVGKISDRHRQLLDVTDQALTLALNVTKAGNTVGDIGATIEQYVKKHGFFVAKDLTGHGVGRTLQEEPTIPNHGQFGKGKSLVTDMVLAIEPIITTEKCGLGIAPDGWTIVSDNGAVGAHFEDTVIVTADQPVVLTRTE